MISSSTKNTLAFLALSIAFVGHSPNAFAADATVLWVDGEVQVQASGSETLEPLVAGDPVPEGSRIVTSVEASCGLGFEGPLSESALTLKPATSVEMTSLSNSALIGLESGSLFVKLSKLKKDSQFAVKTPTAIASARGTGWMQSLDQIEVFEGSVSVTNVFEQEEALSKGDAFDLGSDGSFITKRAANEENRTAWEKFGELAIASPYFNRINADDILYIRETIDVKRNSGECGVAGAYPWQSAVTTGAIISAAQINELKTALTESPFAQNPDFVSTYLEPIPALQSGDPVRASTLRLLLEASENASC